MSTSVRFSLLSVLLILLLAVPAVAFERELVPTPPGGGDGVHLIAADDAVEGTPGSRLKAVHEQPYAPTKGSRYGDIGGDDVLILTDDFVGPNCLDIATNGDLFAASVIEGSWGREVRVYRSTDGGTAWTLWATINDIDTDVEFTNPWLRVGEGAADQVYVAYVRKELGSDRDEVHVTSYDLAAGTLVNDVTVLSQAGLYVWSLHMETDEPTWNGYYLYLVAEIDDGNAHDIWFSRSTDRGATFDAPYPIATLVSTDDRHYQDPHVSYGLGGHVHVGWEFISWAGTFDSAVRYRRASTYADGGLPAWDAVQYLTATNNGIDEEDIRIAASTAGDEVVIVHKRLNGASINSAGVVASADAGVTFPTADVITDGAYWPDDLVYKPTTDQFILGGRRFGSGLQKAAAAAPLTWTPLSVMDDVDYWNQTGMDHRRTIALDPSRNEQVGLLTTYTHLTADSDTLLFDAEWRDGPGYPNYEDGFPIPLTYEPVGDPVVVDMDGDGDLEILFPDESWLVRAYHHDGTVVRGWPVWFPETLDGGSICAGDVTLTGETVIVVGTGAGHVYALTGGGHVMDGWPYAMPEAVPTKVSIGAVGPVYPRSILAVGGTRLRILGPRGNQTPGAWGWTISGETAVGPASVGDVDGDGISEIVCCFGEKLYMFDRDAPIGNLIATLADTPSEAVSLADVDLDGDVEIAVPMPDGTLHLFHSDGTQLAGWPWTGIANSPLSRPAIANCLGSSEPEVAVTEQNFEAHMISSAGSEHPSWPAEAGSWYIYGSPILDMVADQYSADLIVGARGEEAWAWSNFAQVLEGWPKPLSGSVYTSPAAGDLDLDGSLEIVFVTDQELAVVDVNQVPGSGNWHWPQYGYDSRRTGCANCPEDLVTTVEDDPDRVTRVSFAGAAPNPVASGGTVFGFATPVRSAVELVVFDLRGRKVRTVVRGEVDAGEHTLAWDGRDDDGRGIAEGQYLARLRVNGPGVRQEMTRKVMMIR